MISAANMGDQRGGSILQRSLKHTSASYPKLLTFIVYDDVHVSAQCMLAVVSPASKAES